MIYVLPPFLLTLAIEKSEEMLLGLRQRCVKSSWQFNLCADGMVRDVNARVLGGGLKLVDGNDHGWELN